MIAECSSPTASMKRSAPGQGILGQAQTVHADQGHRDFALERQESGPLRHHLCPVRSVAPAGVTAVVFEPLNGLPKRRAARKGWPKSELDRRQVASTDRDHRRNREAISARPSR